MSYIYLASTYSLEAPTNTEEGRLKRERRYQEALRATVEFTKRGEVIFSPIVHSHPMAIEHNLDGDFDFWENIDYAFIDSCTKIRVLAYDNWQKSKGITKELEYARKIGKLIEFYNQEYTFIGVDSAHLRI